MSLLAGCAAVPGASEDPVLDTWVEASESLVDSTRRNPVIAVGGEVELRFRQLHGIGQSDRGVRPMYPQRVRSTNLDVLEVVSRDPDEHTRSVVVRGRQPGEARLLFARHGEWEGVDVRVAEPVHATLTYPLTALGVEPRRLAYVEGATVRLEVTFATGDGDEVRGTPITPEAVEVVGPAELAEASESYLALRLTQAGRVDVRVLDAHHTLDVVATRDIAELDVAVRGGDFGSGCLEAPFDSAGARLKTAAARFPNELYVVVRARLRDGRFAAGVHGAVELEVGPADVCEASPLARSARLMGVLRFYETEAEGFQPDGFELRGGPHPGTCTVRARLGNLQVEREVPVG